MIDGNLDGIFEILAHRRKRDEKLGEPFLAFEPRRLTVQLQPNLQPNWTGRGGKGEDKAKRHSSKTRTKQHVK